MCLQVTPNGFWVGRNVCLCVAAQLMKGEHNEHLPWSFRATLAVQLISHKQDKPHMKHNITLTVADDDATCGQVISAMEKP